MGEVSNHVCYGGQWGGGGGEGTPAPVNGNRVILRSQSEHAFHSLWTPGMACAPRRRLAPAVQVFTWRGTVSAEPLS